MVQYRPVMLDPRLQTALVRLLFHGLSLSTRLQTHKSTSVKLSPQSIR